MLSLCVLVAYKVFKLVIYIIDPGFKFLYPLPLINPKIEAPSTMNHCECLKSAIKIIYVNFQMEGTDFIVLIFTGDSVNREFSYKNTFKILYITIHYGSDQLTCTQGTYTQYTVTLTADTMIFIRDWRIKSVQIQYKRKVGRLQVSSLADNLITDIMKRGRQILYGVKIEYRRSY